MIRARLLTIIPAAAAMAVLVTACGSSGATASGPPASSAPSVPSTPSVAASATASSPVAVTPTPTPTPTPAPTATVPAASPAPSASTCAQLASRMFVHVTKVKAGTGGALTLTGNPAKLVCGGPDDSHYNVAATTVTGHVIPGASIKVFPLPKMHPVAIRPGKLASYLATDEDTRIFLVTGPLTAISALQEQFHP
jgi:hypothetical protein